MTIRPIKENDFPNIIWPGLEEWEEVIKKDYKEMDEKGILWLVAEEHGEPVGQILATMKGKHGKPHLWALRVREDHQNKGIGTLLINRAEEELKNQGATNVTIDVDAWNDNAMRLYQRLGYKKTGGERKEHWTRMHDGKKIEEDVILFDLEKDLL